jgi:hypothetical protein
MQVSREVAEADVQRWLEAKRVRQSKKILLEGNVEVLIESVMEGFITIDENCNLTQVLRFPVGLHENIKQLNFKTRLQVLEVSPFLKKVEQGDGDGRVLAYILAATEQPLGIIQSLDTEDLGVSQSIAVFFL